MEVHLENIRRNTKFRFLVTFGSSLIIIEEVSMISHTLSILLVPPREVVTRPTFKDSFSMAPSELPAFRSGQSHLVG